MAVSNRVRAALTTTVLSTAATGFMAGCGIGGGEDQVAYCTDRDGRIVDDEYCDDDRGPGAGLPRTDRVSAGTRVSGGIGSGIGHRVGTGAGS